MYISNVCDDMYVLYDVGSDVLSHIYHILMRKHV